MEYLQQIIDFVLHIDRHLSALCALYGMWVYAILFLIVFCETGLVVTPFLPGDSLLFVIGSLAAIGALNVEYAIPLLIAAALTGDNTNYWIGRKVGPKIFSKEKSLISQLSLSWGVRAFYYAEEESLDDIIFDQIGILKERGFLLPGDVVVNTGSTPVDLHLPTNVVKVTKVE